MHTPFTYLIGWSKLNKFYYGVRFARDCHPTDLWTKYFTSSKIVKTYRKLYGEPDIIEIRKTFNDPLSSKNWEDKVLRRLKVEGTNHWLNVSSTHFNKSIMTDDMRLHIGLSQKGRTSPMKGKRHSEESKSKISKSVSGENNPMFGVKSPQKDIPWTETQREKYIETMSSKTQEENELRFKRISLAKTGKPRQPSTDETKKKTSQAMKDYWAKKKLESLNLNDASSV